MAQAAFGPRAGRTLAITGGFEFGNKASLLVLMESTCDLPHHDARRIAIVGQVVTVGGQHADAACDQRENRQFLCDQLAGEARSVLDDDDPNAVALNPVEQTGETFPAFDRVGTAHRNVGELVHQLKPGSLREGRDCRALADLAVTVGIGRRTGSEVSDSVDFTFSFQCFESELVQYSQDL